MIPCNLTLELYKNIDEQLYCIYLSDNTGGSGITVMSSTPKIAANKIAEYIADYFEESGEV